MGVRIKHIINQSFKVDTFWCTGVRYVWCRWQWLHDSHGNCRGTIWLHVKFEQWLGHIRGPGKDIKDRSRVSWIWDRGRTEVNVSASYAIVFLFLATQPFHSELPLKLVFYSSAFLLTTSFPQPELFELCFWIFAVTFPNWYLAHPIRDQVQALHTHT